MPCIKFQNLPPLLSFYWDTFDHFSLYEHGVFTKVLRTRPTSKRHVIDRHLSDNWHIKIMFHVICQSVMLFHMREEFITFPFNNTCLSTTEWGVISFCLCIYSRLTANQTTRKSEILGSVLRILSA